MVTKTIRKSPSKKRKTFKKSDYNSGDGMLTYVWGPPLWHYLHTMSFNYPVHPTSQQKRQYRNFILSLKYTLPCGKCRANFTKNVKQLPLTIADMESRATFSFYVYRLHEVVNKMLQKNSGLTYADIRERYEHFRARCVPSKAPESKENGCTEPLYGEKAKCLLKIVPLDTQCETMEIDEKCVKRRLL